MRTLAEISKLLDSLEHKQADDLEDQDLDFKEWIHHSRSEALAKVIELAVCMANGGGGTVVFGIRDRVTGRTNAIPGIPLEIDLNSLKKQVYDSTDPKITPVFEELSVPEGTKRLLIMQIYPGAHIYTDTGGHAKIRIGKDCKPYTGTIRRRVLDETGESDFTAEIIPGRLDAHISPAAVEAVRKWAEKEKAPKTFSRYPIITLLPHWT